MVSVRLFQPALLRQAACCQQVFSVQPTCVSRLSAYQSWCWSASGRSLVLSLGKVPRSLTGENKGRKAHLPTSRSLLGYGQETLFCHLPGRLDESLSILP